jgi:hypothetical protein
VHPAVATDRRSHTTLATAQSYYATGSPAKVGAATVELVVVLEVHSLHAGRLWPRDDAVEVDVAPGILRAADPEGWGPADLRVPERRADADSVVAKQLTIVVAVDEDVLTGEVRDR